MKFNMGCGHKKLPGYVNVDAFAECAPDQQVDLEQTPWPWPSNCAEEILFHHSLEHMGQVPAIFLAIMKEVYRIAVPGGQVTIHVPHPRHDSFLNDPTHVRVITPEVLTLFDRELNDKWQRIGASNTPLALYTGVDFKIADVSVTLTERYTNMVKSGRMTQAQVAEAMNDRNNVAEEYRIKLTARKAAP